MKVIREIPDGYEIVTDMFGEPYLQRKTTPRQQRLAESLVVPFLIVLASVIGWILLG